MAVSIDKLITDLRRSYVDDLPESEQALSPEHLKRSILRSVVMVNRDFQSGYKVVGDEVTPSPDAGYLEYLLLAAMVCVAEMMLARYARFPSVKSGDKSVSHSDQVEAWSRLHARYMEQYTDAVMVQKANELDDIEPELYG